MTLYDITDPNAIEQAINEFDELGRQAFLDKYGFDEAKTYYLLHEGRLYDSKAIVGVAHGYEHPEAGPLRASDFSGGEATVEKKLEELGYEVYKRSKDDRARDYWAFAANPDRYQIREAISKLDEDLWAIGNSKVKFGDRVIVWQTLDEKKRRGIVSLGEVRSYPETLSDENNPFWTSDEDGEEKIPRVWLRYVQNELFPIWLGDTKFDHLLEDLSVVKARGGTVFHVTEDQWNDLIRLIGGWPGETEETLELLELAKELDTGSHGRGQGRGLSYAARRAVELHAMKRAEEYFQAQGYSVNDVSSKASFDLMCRKDDGEIHVEVKGTTGSGESVILTVNEVEQTQKHDCILFVVAEIDLQKRHSDNPIADGGIVNFFRPWEADNHKLQPLTFKCELDYSLSDRI